jgi:hypothetical protein
MSHDDEFASIPRPARVPSIVDAVEPTAVSTPPKKRSEVVAAGALFVTLLGVMTVAVGVVTFAIF